MNYGEIKETDIANGIGVRVSLFVSGCRHHCPDCFNSMTWDFSYGKPFDERARDRVIDALSRSYVRGITLIGGEPMEPENQRELVKLLRIIKQRFPQKDVWLYSGFTLEEMMGDSRANCETTDELLSMVDVLVDGRFERDRKNISLRFRGSENQRLIDMNKTREYGKPVLWNE